MKYVTLDLEIFGYQKTDEGETLNVRVLDSPAGDSTRSGPEKSVLPAGLRKRLNLLEKRQLNLAETIELGIDLGNALFPAGARSLLQESRAGLENDQGLRIALRTNSDSDKLLDVPWEYTYLPDRDTPEAQRGVNGFLALNRKFSLVRYEGLSQRRGTLQSDKNVQLAVLLANPASPEFPALALEREEELIREALAGVSHIEPTFYSNATAQTLLDALTAGAHLLHFSGHGSFDKTLGEEFGTTVGEGSVVLMDGKMSSSILARNLEGTSVRLVVLGACEGGRRDGVNIWSGVAPALTQAGMPAVVAMQYKIFDKNALLFSRNLYRSLAAGNEIDEAVTVGRLAILTAARDQMDRDWGVPVLYLRAKDGVLFQRKDQSGVDQPTVDQPRIQESTVPATSGSPGATAGSEKIDTRALRNAMTAAFNIEDLEILCADIQALFDEDDVKEKIDLELVGGSGKTGIILKLIDYVNRRGLLHYLVKAVRSARPGII